MNIWTDSPLKPTAQTARSLSRAPSGGPLIMWLGGVALPLVPLIYGINCLITGRARFFGNRGADLDTDGPTALALAVAYIAFGAFFHFHFFWGLHRKLRRFSPIMKVFSLLVFVGCFGFAGCGVLMK